MSHSLHPLLSVFIFQLIHYRNQDSKLRAVHELVETSEPGDPPKIDYLLGNSTFRVPPPLKDIQL